MMNSSPSIVLALALSATAAMAAEELSASNERTQDSAADTTLLTLDRIFGSSEFEERGLGQYKWSRRNESYFTLEAPQAGGKGRDLVRNDCASGRKEVVVPAKAFAPEEKTEPLEVESFEFSADESKLLLYSNSRRVWRRNTRGDYWVLDLAKAGSLRKLGGNAAPSTLMFAKFSPDGTRVAYVRENNLYVQDLRRMKITALTKDGSPTLINGTSDWVSQPPPAKPEA